GQVADMTFPYFHQALTRRINGSSKEGGARLIFQADTNTTFYDGAGKAILKLIQNRSRARHDLLYPGCSRAAPDDPDGCRELLSEAISIPLRELPAVCTFFMDVEDGAIMPSSSDPGDNVTLKVLEDVLVGVSACPAQNCNPTPGEILVEINHSVVGEEQA